MPAQLSPNVYADDRCRFEKLTVEDRMHLTQLAALINRREVADAVWRLRLNSAERASFSEGYEFAYGRLLTLGIWATAKGLPPIRALLQLARLLNYSTPLRLDAIALQLDYLVVDPEAQLERLRIENDVVIVEEPFAVYWHGEEIEVAWDRYRSVAEYLTKLFRAAKAGEALSRFDFGEAASENVLRDRKTNLRRIIEFPDDLFEKIEAPRGVGQRISIAPNRIAIVDTHDSERLQVQV